MNLATHGTEVSALAPVLYMALELSDKSWRLALSDGTKRRQVSVPAADLAKLASGGEGEGALWDAGYGPVATRQVATASGCTGT